MAVAGINFDQSKYLYTELLHLCVVTWQPRAGSRTSLEGAEEDDTVAELKVESRPHKYVVQAIVLRDSWPLNQHQWAFVQELKEKEKEELKGAFPDSSLLLQIISLRCRNVFILK